MFDRLPAYRVLLAICVALSVSQPIDAQTAAADSTTIHQLSRQFSQAYMRGDAAAMAALYSPDAVIFPEGSDAITDREAIKRYWTLKPGRRVTRHEITPARVVMESTRTITARS